MQNVKHAAIEGVEDCGGDNVSLLSILLHFIIIRKNIRASLFKNGTKSGKKTFLQASPNQETNFLTSQSHRIY